MALDAYLKLKGKKQGAINGSVTKTGLKDTIAVSAVNHEIVRWVWEGPKKHSPLVITKEIDKSSPLLYSALSAKEVMIEWELQQYRAGKDTKEQHYYTIKLKDAEVAQFIT